MTGPLSLNQQKILNDERRKEQLHQVKLAREINKFGEEARNTEIMTGVKDNNMAMPAVTNLSPLGVQRLDRTDTRVKNVRTDVLPLEQAATVTREPVAKVTPGIVYDGSGNPIRSGSGDVWRTADTVQQPQQVQQREFLFNKIFGGK